MTWYGGGGNGLVGHPASRCVPCLADFIIVRSIMLIFYIVNWTKSGSSFNEHLACISADETYTLE